MKFEAFAALAVGLRYLTQRPGGAPERRTDPGQGMMYLAVIAMHLVGLLIVKSV